MAGAFNNFGRYAQQPPMMYGNPQPQFTLKGRYVSSISEVSQAQIDLDGSETYFIYPAGNTIFAKSIDMNGNSIIKKYVLQASEHKQNIDAVIKDLSERVKAIEDSLTKPSKEKDK